MELKQHGWVGQPGHGQVRGLTGPRGLAADLYREVLATLSMANGRSVKEAINRHVRDYQWI